MAYPAADSRIDALKLRREAREAPYLSKVQAALKTAERQLAQLLVHVHDKTVVVFLGEDCYGSEDDIDTDVDLEVVTLDAICSSGMLQVTLHELGDDVANSQARAWLRDVLVPDLTASGYTCTIRYADVLHVQFYAGELRAQLSTFFGCCADEIE